MSANALRLVWLCWLVLVLQQGIYAWQYQAPWIIWLGRLLPLFLFVPGMLRDRLRSFIWLCFVSLLYFIAQVEQLFAFPGAALPVAGTIAVVGLFVASMLYVRWRAREQRAATRSDGGMEIE